MRIKKGSYARGYIWGERIEVYHLCLPILDKLEYEEVISYKIIWIRVETISDKIISVRRAVPILLWKTIR